MHRIDDELERLGGSEALIGAPQEELDRLQRALGMAIPATLKHWWRVAGIDNSLPGIALGFLMNRRDEIVLATDTVAEATGREDLVAFASDGAGDFFLLGPNDEHVVFWDHETNALVETHQTLDDWARLLVDRAIELAPHRRARAWHFALTIYEVTDEHALFELLELAGLRRPPDFEWRAVRAIPPDGPLGATGTRWEAELIAGDHEIPIAKTTWELRDPRYPREGTHTLCFREDPGAAEPLARVRPLEPLLHQAGLRYRMSEPQII